MISDEGTIAFAAGRESIRAGHPALDAVEAALRVAEADPAVTSAGRGGFPNMLGEVELDAGIMDGRTLRTGSVGALKGFSNAISVARRVMDRLPHEFLVGEGACRFASECGEVPSDLLTDHSRSEWRKWLDESLSQEHRPAWPDVPLSRPAARVRFPQGPHDTVVAIAKDVNGDIASGATTSGWPFCYPGRVGDSPIIGAGHYCHNAMGAAACTHTGEMTIRCCTAHSVTQYVRMGCDVAEACRRACTDLAELTTGYLDHVVVYAVDSSGHHCALSTGIESTYWFWCQENGSAEHCAAKV